MRSCHRVVREQSHSEHKKHKVDVQQRKLYQRNVCRLKLSKKPVVQHSKLNPVCCLSTTAQLLGHQQGVIAIDLQQVEQEEPVSMGIQTHGPHTLLGQRGIGAPSHLAEGLENPVVLLQEKPGCNLEEM